MMHTTTTESRRPFLPGMGVDWLLPVYDSFTWLLGLDRVRRNFLFQARLQPGHRVLDIGCGTGTLAVLVKELLPSVDVTGVDPDDKAVARAARKARRRGVNVRFDRGYADALAYPDASFDRVLSSFMFHHLDRGDKERTVREVRRVLRPGGSLHLVDFGRPDPTCRRSWLPGLHTPHRLTDNDEQTIVGLLRDAGFLSVTKTEERSWLGVARIVSYRGGVGIGGS
jgi:ubiquinone/menaquinone biosynthesis C-methylase UbiE